MNREIKFRGKRLDSGEWVYGYYVFDAAQNIHVICTNHKGSHNASYDYLHEVCLVDPATVGQFTGIKDNHGQGSEIYKSDIVRITAACGEEYVGEVVWNKDRLQWAVDWGGNEPDAADGELWDFGSIVFDCGHLVEVIGNTHDNPDLLKVGGDIS